MLWNISNSYHVLVKNMHRFIGRADLPCIWDILNEILVMGPAFGMLHDHAGRVSYSVMTIDEHAICCCCSQDLTDTKTGNVLYLSISRKIVDAPSIQESI